MTRFRLKHQGIKAILELKEKNYRLAMRPLDVSASVLKLFAFNGRRNEKEKKSLFS